MPNFEDLIDYAVKQGLLSRAEVAVALQNPKHRGKGVERILLDEGLLQEPELMKVMSEVYQLPLIELSSELLDSKTAADVPKAVLQNFQIFPLKKSDGDEELPYATSDPFDLLAADTLRLVTGIEVRPVLVAPSQISKALSGRLVTREGLELLGEQILSDQSLDYLEAVLEGDEAQYQTENDAPIILLVDSLLREAIFQKASDIHVEPLENSFRVRYRLDGLLRTVVQLPKSVQRACVARIKIISGLDISECRKPQDGRTNIRTESSSVDMRVSTVPTFHGEKVVLRLLDQGTSRVNLESLGLSPKDLGLINTFLNSSHGMILVTGPTGSGKTSTLYAALRVLNRETVNITTVEDPVEYQVEGLAQVQVNPKAGVTFASALRSFLRQDPDIILVGEIRDLETGEIAIQAAQTGHLVFSTLHTNDAPSTLSRLILMGLEPHLVAGSLLLVVGQRLVRKLCPECRKPGSVTQEQRNLLLLAVERRVPARVYEAGGCKSCSFLGYRGRVGLFELLPVTTRLRQQIMEDSSDDSLWLAARGEGMKTLLEDGLDKVEQGVTSLDEVLRVVTIKRATRELAEQAVLASPEAEAEVVEFSRPTEEGFAEPLFSWRKPISVGEVMSRRVLSLHPKTNLVAAAEQLIEEGISGAPVVNAEDCLVGVLSLNDLVAYGFLLKDIALGKSSEIDLCVEQVMSKRAVTIESSASLEEAAKLFLRYKVHRLVVIKSGKVCGLLTPTDIVLRGDIFQPLLPKSETLREPVGQT